MQIRVLMLQSFEEKNIYQLHLSNRDKNKILQNFDELYL